MVDAQGFCHKGFYAKFGTQIYNNLTNLDKYEIYNLPNMEKLEILKKTVPYWANFDKLEKTAAFGHFNPKNGSALVPNGHVKLLNVRPDVM